MAERALDIQAGFLPYGDGSGYQVSVCLRECAGEGFMLSIDTSYHFEARLWPEVRDGIERLLRALPLTVDADDASGITRDDIEQPHPSDA